MCLFAATAGANLSRQDSEGDQPLHWAATKGYIEVRHFHNALKYLLRALSKCGVTVAE